MISDRRTIWSMMVIALTLAVGVAASLMFWSDAADDADRAAADTNATRSLVNRIRSTRPSAAAGAPAESIAARLPNLIDDAFKAADIDPEKQLAHTANQAVRHVDRGDYNEVPVQLTLSQLSLRQLLGFVGSLAGQSPDLRLRNLHISYDAQNSTGPADAEWNLELTVSYLTPARSNDRGT